MKRLVSAIKDLAAEKLNQFDANRKVKEQRRHLSRLEENLKKNTDEMKGITWISHKSDSWLENSMSLYFGTKDGSSASYPLRMKFIYCADSWLFLQSVTIKIDEQVFNLKEKKFERINGSHGIWEWSDSKVENIAMQNNIIAAQRVLIRYNGENGYHDFVLPETQKIRMKEIVLAWQRYGGIA